MDRGSRHLGKSPGPIPRTYVPTSAARVRNASVGAEAFGGQSWKVQSGRYNKPAGCSTPEACRGRPCKQTNKQTTTEVKIYHLKFLAEASLLRSYEFQKIKW
jgi:hypothetical protein